MSVIKNIARVPLTPQNLTEAGANNTLHVVNPDDDSETIDVFARLKSLEIYDENGTLIN